jgi:hypothetical protein
VIGTFSVSGLSSLTQSRRTGCVASLAIELPIWWVQKTIY